MLFETILIRTVDYLMLLKTDIDGWNEYRQQHPDVPCSLAEQDLSQGYFFEGNFRNVDLHGANLQRACLIGADLQGANLRGADLRDAYLDDAILRDADLRDADLTGAHTERVDWHQAQGVQMDGAMQSGERRQIYLGKKPKCPGPAINPALSLTARHHHGRDGFSADPGINIHH